MNINLSLSKPKGFDQKSKINHLWQLLMRLLWLTDDVLNRGPCWSSLEAGILSSQTYCPMIPVCKKKSAREGFSRELENFLLQGVRPYSKYHDCRGQ